MSYPIKGACQCGQVQIVLNNPPAKVLACHCKECQKLSTSVFSLTLFVKEETVEISGEMGDWSRNADGGNTAAAKFCTGCGNRIYHYNPLDTSVLKLKLTAFDDVEFKPDAHIWVKSKKSWYQIPEGVPTFETVP
ncbi:GFA family protein [Marinomonas balearica]|uniref:CENP-V/GFA domain-containing protein n=1 Tax=Marinomonas balearica TaxID=491947 RepID=A0A4R6M3I4_9GAMM|nr:GFA family protein [Marinomonas balearica]TDO95744.1 hypothetical protein DFP79_3098 [Marinomonas balearica]